MHLWIVISGIPPLLACFFRRQVVATVVVHCAIKLGSRNTADVWVDGEECRPSFFRSLSLKLFALNRKRRTSGKTIWQVFFFLPPAPKKVLKLAGFAQLHAVRTGWFFLLKTVHNNISQNYFFKKKNLHAWSSGRFCFSFISFLGRGLEWKRKCERRAGGSDAYKRAIRRRISRAS